MKRAVNAVIQIKRIAFAALLVAGACFCVLAILPYTVPRHEIRDAAIHSLQAATGIKPEIKGIHFSTVPRTSILLEQVRFGSGEETFSAGSIRATIRFLPLLIGDVEIASLTFESAHFHIEFGPNGARLVGLPPQPAGGSGMPEIKIADSTVDLHSAVSGMTEKLTGVSASLAWSGNGFSTLASFEWRGVPSTAGLRIADTSALGENARSPVRFRFENDFLRAGFEGAFAFRKGLQAEGGLSVESRSLRGLLAAFGIEVPTRGGFGPLSLKSRAQITPVALTASNLSIELDGNRADGTLSLAIEGKRPMLQGTLAADTADFSTYMSGFSLTDADKHSWSTEPLDIKPLSGFDLDLRLSAGKIVFGKTAAQKVALAAAVKDGRFTLSAGEGQVFGGLLRGTASIGPAPAGADVRINASLKDFNSAQGFSALADNRRLEGTGTLAVSLAGSGANVSAITRSLQGSTELTVLDGALSGINVENALRTISKKPFSAVAALRGGKTPFNLFAAKLAITDGNAVFDEAQIESGSVAVTLNGLASIPERDLDLHGVAKLVAAADAGDKAALPFFLRGSWDNPSLTPGLLRHSGLDSGTRLALLLTR